MHGHRIGQRLAVANWPSVLRQRKAPDQRIPGDGDAGQDSDQCFASQFQHHRPTEPAMLQTVDSVSLFTQSSYIPRGVMPQMWR